MYRGWLSAESRDCLLGAVEAVISVLPTSFEGDFGDTGQPSGGRGKSIPGGGDTKILSSIPVKESEELDEEVESDEEDEEDELSDNVRCLANLARSVEASGLLAGLF